MPNTRNQPTVDPLGALLQRLAEKSNPSSAGLLLNAAAEPLWRVLGIVERLRNDLQRKSKETEA